MQLCHHKAAALPHHFTVLKNVSSWGNDNHNHEQVPKTPKTPMQLENLPARDKWMKGTEEEFQAQVDNGTFGQLAPRTER